MKHQEKLWKTKHFILHYEDRIDSQHNHGQNTGDICHLCRDKNIIPTPKDTHLHVLWECTAAKDLWNALGDTLTKINLPGFERNKAIILGMKNVSPKDKAMDTVIGAAIHYLWIARCDYRHEKIIPKPGSIMAKCVIKAFKTAIENHFLMYKRNNTIENFKMLFKLDGIFTITPQNTLQFFI